MLINMCTLFPDEKGNLIQNISLLAHTDESEIYSVYSHFLYYNNFTTLKYINPYHYYLLHTGTMCTDEFVTGNACDNIMLLS